MKRLLIAAAALLGMGFFTNCAAQAGTMPYEATYSSNFTPGNAAYASMVLDLWKDWDDNAFSRHDYFADTITMRFPDGTVTRGKKNNMEMAVKYRGSMAKVKSIIHAWMPLHSTDRNEDLVCMWGQEQDTMPDGKVVTKDVHEVWWFNKDGKVSGMRQWVANFGK